MCHHPLRFSEDCVDFNMHEEIEEPEKATGVEEKKLPDGLEEAADEFANQDCVTFISRKKGFKAGAEWQKAKDQELIELAEDHAMLAGMNKMEQQMMEKGSEAFISAHNTIPVLPMKDVSDLGLDYGDKVRVIVIKEEQK